VGWLGWIVVGFVAGMLAKTVTGVRDLGCIATTIVGILGGILGGLLFVAVGGSGIEEFSLYSLLVAFVGACILLFVFGVAMGRRRE